MANLRPFQSTTYCLTCTNQYNRRSYCTYCVHLNGRTRGGSNLSVLYHPCNVHTHPKTTFTDNYNFYALFCTASLILYMECGFGWGWGRCGGREKKRASDFLTPYLNLSPLSDTLNQSVRGHLCNFKLHNHISPHIPPIPLVNTLSTHHNVSINYNPHE